MARRKVLRLYCDGAARQAFRRGTGHMAVVVQNAFQAEGWTVHLHAASEAEAMPDEDHAMVMARDPGHAHCLNLRNAHLPQFWRIEESNQPATFSVALAQFDPDRIDPVQAQVFVEKWRPRVLQDRPVTQQGFIFMPLHGRLQDRRLFQTHSPLEMIEAVLDADPRRPIRAILAGGGLPRPEDAQALADLSQRHPRFQLVQDPAADLLAACDLVVTQSSPLALHGFFAAKPAVLFGRTDFHHIAANVPALDVPGAFARLRAPPPDFDRYLFWFLRLRAIGQHFDLAPQKIRDRCRALGWPI